MTIESLKLQTVTGEVPQDKIGFCQSHEHLFISRGRSFDVSPALLMDSFEKTKAEVERYRAAGGSTLVDAQPVGCNRMSDNLRQISLQTGVYILAVTGFHKMEFYPENHWIFTMDEAALSQLFIQELISGMYVDCDQSYPEVQGEAKAGLIKAAFEGEQLSSQYQKLFYAAIYAAKQTGRAMMVHIEKGSNPIRLFHFLTGEGIRPGRLIFCHMDRACEDVGILKELLKCGIYLELDTIGRFKYHSDEREIEIICELLEAGYEKQLLLSLDVTNARMKSYTPGAIGLDYLIRTFVPMLRRAGVSDGAIRSFLHDNFARASGLY